MSTFVSQFLLALSKECEIYEDLLVIAKDKRQIIIDGRTKKLDAMTKREQTLVLSLGKLEEIRAKIVNEILKEKNIVSVNSINELFRYFSDEERMEAAKLRATLKNTVDEIRSENGTNEQLLKQSLDMINFNLNLLTQVNDHSSYRSDAVEDFGEERRSIFDVKV